LVELKLQPNNSTFTLPLPAESWSEKGNYKAKAIGLFGRKKKYIILSQKMSSMNEWRDNKRAEARKYTTLEKCEIDKQFNMKTVEAELRSPNIRVSYVYAMLDLIEDQNLGRKYVFEATELVLRMMDSLTNKVAVPILMRLFEFADIVRQAKDTEFDGWTAHFPDLAFSGDKKRVSSHFERIFESLFDLISSDISEIQADDNLSSNAKKILKTIQYSILANQEDYFLPWRVTGQVTWDVHYDSGRALHQLYILLCSLSSEKFGKPALYLSKNASHYGGVMDYKSYSINVSDQAFQENDELLCKTIILRGLKYLALKNPDAIDEEFLAYLKRVFPKKGIEDKGELDLFLEKEIFSQYSSISFAHPAAIRLSIKLRRCDIFAELVCRPNTILPSMSIEADVEDESSFGKKRRKISYEWTPFKLIHDEILPFLSITKGFNELRRICPTNMNEFISHSKNYCLQSCARVFEFLSDIHFRASLLFWTCMDSEPNGISCFTINPEIFEQLNLSDLWTRPDELISFLLNGYETIYYNSIPGTFKQFTPCAEELNLALSLAKLKTEYWLRVLDDSNECSRNGFLLWLRILFVIFRNDGSSSGAAFLHFLSELSNDSNRTPKVAKTIIDKILTHRNSLNVFFDEVKALAKGQSTSVLGISPQVISDADFQILGFRPVSRYSTKVTIRVT
jgi:hypothetical protein